MNRTPHPHPVLGRVRRSSALLLGAALATMTIAACGDDDDSSGAGEVSVADAWSREPAVGQPAAAVYFTLTNGTDEAITLVAASSPVTDDVQIHETLMGDDGTMSMNERDEGFEIPAGGELVLEPGGNHVMLLGIDAETYPDEVEVTLEFDGADPLELVAEVRE